jgi:hypothetical protein
LFVNFFLSLPLSAIDINFNDHTKTKRERKRAREKKEAYKERRSKQQTKQRKREANYQKCRKTLNNFFPRNVTSSDHRNVIVHFLSPTKIYFIRLFRMPKKGFSFSSCESVKFASFFAVTDIYNTKITSNIDSKLFALFVSLASVLIAI